MFSIMLLRLQVWLSDTRSFTLPHLLSAITSPIHSYYVTDSVALLYRYKGSPSQQRVHPPKDFNEEVLSHWFVLSAAGPLCFVHRQRSVGRGSIFCVLVLCRFLLALKGDTFKRIAISIRGEGRGRVIFSCLFSFSFPSLFPVFSL